jgi:hypothetical protein
MIVADRVLDSTDGPSRDALASGDRGYGRHMFRFR